MAPTLINSGVPCHDNQRADPAGVGVMMGIAIMMN
jgi:hypothetical protein